MGFVHPGACPLCGHNGHPGQLCRFPKHLMNLGRIRVMYPCSCWNG